MPGENADPQYGNNPMGFDPRFNPWGKVGMGSQLANAFTGIGTNGVQDPNQPDQSMGADGTGLGGQSESAKQTTEDSALGAASGAVTGGMVAGPAGAVIGGGLGLLKGLFT